jgi:hypothetical protein
MSEESFLSGKRSGQIAMAEGGSSDGDLCISVQGTGENGVEAHGMPRREKG